MITRSVDVLRQQLVSLCMLYGYELVATDLVEDAELFLTSASAAVVPRLYAFDRQGKSHVLRPEFTTAAMKRYLTEGINQPARWQFFDTVFEQNTDTRSLVQSYAFGLELIRADGLEADLEIIEIALAVSACLAQEDLPIVLNHVGFIQSVLEPFELDPFVVRLLISQPDQVKLLIESSNRAATSQTDAEVTQTMLNVLLESTQYSRTMGGRTHVEITDRLLRKYSRNSQADNMRHALEVIRHWNEAAYMVSELDELRAYTQDNPKADEHLRYIARLCENLVASGVREEFITVRLNAAKNWQYYSGITFSIGDDASPLITGGRYNNLSQMMGAAVSIPAVGFACSLDAYIEQHQLSAPVQVNAETPAAYRTLAQMLRSHQISVVPFSSFNCGSVIKQQADTTYTLDDVPFATIEELVSYLKGRS